MVAANRQVPPILERFEDFCAEVGLGLEPFQLEIAAAALDPGCRELLVLIPRGNGKTRLVGALAVFHLLTVEDAQVVVGSSSRETAGALFAYASADAAHFPDRIAVHHLRMRTASAGTLHVVASRGLKAHSWTPSLLLADEIHAWADPQLLDAFATSLIKRRDSRLVGISSAGAGDDSPLGRWRKRMLALPEVEREGALVGCRGEQTQALIRRRTGGRPDRAGRRRGGEAREPGLVDHGDRPPGAGESTAPIAFARFHAGPWTAREGSWLPPGAWSAIKGEPRLEPGERTWAALDLGGEESDTALVWGQERGGVINAGAWIGSGDAAVLEAAERVRELAARYRLVELCADPWRGKQLMLEAERDLGLRVVELPQTDGRMCPASASLRQRVVERAIAVPRDPRLAAHAANAVARHSRRGWRLEAPARGVPVDAMVALAMLVARIESEAARRPARLVGWV